MALDKTNFWISLVLVIYLLFIGVGAASMVIFNFPTEEEGKIIFAQNENKELSFYPFGAISSIDQGFLLLAFLAGMAGSFLHAAHSLSTYMGNSSFKPSWTTWYFLRPWIGGVLGFAIYLTFRAGLVSGASAANPYGVVALGFMGGWFSKTTTDKLPPRPTGGAQIHIKVKNPEGIESLSQESPLVFE